MKDFCALQGDPTRFFITYRIYSIVSPGLLSFFGLQVGLTIEWGLLSGKALTVPQIWTITIAIILINPDELVKITKLCFRARKWQILSIFSQVKILLEESKPHPKVSPTR